MVCTLVSDTLAWYSVFEIHLLLGASVVPKCSFLIPAARCCFPPSELGEQELQVRRGVPTAASSGAVPRNPDQSWSVFPPGLG